MTQRYSIDEIQRLNGKSPGIETKARRLLADGRVDVVRKTAREVLVDVAGDTDRHRVQADAIGWSCDCPAFVHRRRCSHVTAAQLVVGGPGLSRLPPKEHTRPTLLTNQPKGKNQ